jgi:hypothetical protein
MTTQPLPLVPPALVRGTPTFDVNPADGTPVGIRATQTRLYDFANGQRMTITATSARSTAVAAGEVMLHASARMFIRVGNSSVVATAGAGSFPLEAGEKFHLRITSGQQVAAIRDSADGFLTVMPVAG